MNASFDISVTVQAMEKELFKSEGTIIPFNSYEIDPHHDIHFNFDISAIILINYRKALNKAS